MAELKRIPSIDRQRCEAKAECVAVCPYHVFAIERLRDEDKATLGWRASLKSLLHGGKQAYVVDPDACQQCGLCVKACPEQAIRLLRVDR